MTLLLSAQNVRVAFGARRVLDRVSLSLREGEHVALIGPNGAGKTTLLRALSGICPLAEGAVELLGKKLGSYGLREQARILTYVPQQLSVPFRYTVFDFVAMARYAHARAWSVLQREDRDKVWWALEQTGSGDLADRILVELSGGERQLVLISAALAQETAVMLLDEPMNGLDPRHQDAVQSVLEVLRHTHRKGLISATHELNSAALTADRIVALKEGRVLFDAAPRECLTGGNLERLYDKKFVMVGHPQRGVPMVLPGIPSDE